MTPAVHSLQHDLPRAERADGSVNRHFIRYISTLLVCRPNASQYGHLAMELLMALDEARRRNQTLYLLAPYRPVNPALFEIESTSVRIVRCRGARAAWLQLSWLLHDRADDIRRVIASVSREVRDALSRELRRHAGDDALPAALRVRLRRMEMAAAPPPRPVRSVRRPYMRRQSMREPLPVALAPKASERAIRAANEIGIPADAPLVAVHAREAGFKRGREVHERPGKSDPRDDSLRNARIETYFPAIDKLVAEGFIVVRLGDSTMTPVRRDGVVDLATRPDRHPELDVYCLLRSRFAIVGESGPGQVALLTNTPTVTVNATDPISSYPIRRDGLYLLKHVEDRDTGRALPLRELLSERYLRLLRNPDRFRYIDNTADEILDAVREMQELIAATVPDSYAQAEYRRLATEAGEALRGRLRYVRKFGTDQGFLGDGRIGRAFVQAHLG